ncbi:MAG: hypothetical protein ACLU38_09645 [Dysosmobacter sp.]
MDTENRPVGIVTVDDAIDRFAGKVQLEDMEKDGGYAADADKPSPPHQCL